MHRACDHTQRPSQAQREIQDRQCSLAASNPTSTDDHHILRPYTANHSPCCVRVIVASFSLQLLAAWVADVDVAGVALALPMDDVDARVVPELL